MKKTFLPLTVFLLLGGLAMAQAKDTTIELQKAVYQRAVLIYLPYSPTITQKAFSDFLSKTSKKDQKKAKGYLLSANTGLAKSNVSNADMHFFIGFRDDQNTNASVIYLKLNSFSQGEYNLDSTAINFDRQEAQDYLNNLATAIQPYAADLQQKWQQKNLHHAQKEYAVLNDEGNQLEMKRKTINLKLSQNKNGKRVDGLTREKNRNDKKITENLAARTHLNADIAKQMAALALLSH